MSENQKQSAPPGPSLLYDENSEHAKTEEEITRLQRNSRCLEWLAWLMAGLQQRKGPLGKFLTESLKVNRSGAEQGSVGDPIELSNALMAT